MHALRILLGGVWAKERTPEAVAHLVQDNWNKGAFAWRRALIEHIFDFFKSGTDWLNISEHKFRLLKWQPDEGKSLGTTPDQKQMPLLYMKTDRCHFHVEQGGYLCYSQIKIWQKGDMTSDKRSSFSKREG